MYDNKKRNNVGAHDCAQRTKNIAGRNHAPLHNGITLVSLVITIIVLLILAGVAINITTNPDSLFGRTNDAVTEWNAAVNQEKDLFGLLGEYTGGEANPPIVKEGMIPVYYDNGWKKADKTKDDWYSYDTINKKWANVVTVKETGGTKTRAEYQSAPVGEAIAEDDILAMFVWIPRYAYKITSGYHSAANNQNDISSPVGDIQIKFLKDTGKQYNGGEAVSIEDTADKTTNALTNGNKYVVHPAFTKENIGDDITGFWVGKFESSNYTSQKDNTNITSTTTDTNLLYGRGDNKNVTIRPNVTSWRNIPTCDNPDTTTVVETNIYDVCQAMKNTGNIHGLNSQTDTMMMKNSQWGAVAYLAQSDYGNKQIASDKTSGIWNNSYTEGYVYENVNNSAGYGMENYCVTLTGMAEAKVGRDSSTSYYSKSQEGSKDPKADKITIKYNNVDKITTAEDGTTTGGINGKLGSDFTREFYRYNTEIGQKGSTTRNVYGVYDMSGGSWEYMASFLENSTATYAKGMKIKPAKYIEKYAGNGANAENRQENYEENKNVYGDAVYETSLKGDGTHLGWNDDYSGFPYLTAPFFVRGGNFLSGNSAGVFYFGIIWGGSGSYSGFRVVAL